MFTTLILFWIVIIAVVVLIFPLFSSRFGNLSLVASFALGYIFLWMDFGIWWIFVFAIGVLISPFFHMNTSVGNFEEAPSSRIWTNQLLKVILGQVTGLDVPHIDIGGSLPTFTTIYTAPKELRPNGFDSIVAFSYKTSMDTSLTLCIPLRVPGYGEINVPIKINAPHIEGKIRLDCRLEELEYEAYDLKKGEMVKKEQFMALSIAFDQIDTIHVGNLQVMNAPKFGWLQSINKVKEQIHYIINSALSTESITVMLFDGSFVNIGSITKPRVRSFNDQGEGYVNGVCTDDEWTVSELTKEIRTCTHCGKKVLSQLPTCCTSEIPPEIIPIIPGSTLPQRDQDINQLIQNRIEQRKSELTRDQ